MSPSEVQHGPIRQSYNSLTSGGVAASTRGEQSSGGWIPLIVYTLRGQEGEVGSRVRELISNTKTHPVLFRAVSHTYEMEEENLDATS